MAWRRLGLVYRPDGHHPALLTHAALPVAVALGGDLVRVFFSGRDAHNRSAIGSFVLRLGERTNIEEPPGAPVLTPGGVGAFDDAGCGLGSVVAGDAGDRLYYMGWNVGGSTPWRNAIGLALGCARTGRFERMSAGPIMDRDTVDHYSLSYPWVLRLGPSDWRMWYGTHLAWGADKSDMNHAIRHARSRDGVTWARDATVAVAPEPPEIAVVRPCVLPSGEMWFARREEDGPYHLGHASAPDLSTWTRDGSAILEAETNGWEGGAITYASVIEINGRRWMLYNGAAYGAGGIGLAVWEAPLRSGQHPGDVIR
jgi:hypothetical protein